MLIDIHGAGQGARAVAPFPSGSRTIAQAGQRLDRFTGIPDRAVVPTVLQSHPTRSVLTTRSDGSLRTHIEESGRQTIIAERFHRSPLQAGLDAPFANHVFGTLPQAGF